MVVRLSVIFISRETLTREGCFCDQLTKKGIAAEFRNRVNEDLVSQGRTSKGLRMREAKCVVKTVYLKIDGKLNKVGSVSEA